MTKKMKTPIQERVAGLLSLHSIRAEEVQATLNLLSSKDMSGHVEAAHVYVLHRISMLKVELEGIKRQIAAAEAAVQKAEMSDDVN